MKTVYEEPRDRKNRIKTLEAQMEYEVGMSMLAKEREDNGFWSLKIKDARRKFIFRLNEEYKGLTGDFYKDGKYRGGD